MRKCTLCSSQHKDVQKITFSLDREMHSLLISVRERQRKMYSTSQIGEVWSLNESLMAKTLLFSRVPHQDFQARGLSRNYRVTMKHGASSVHQQQLSNILCPVIQSCQSNISLKLITTWTHPTQSHLSSFERH